MPPDTHETKPAVLWLGAEVYVNDEGLHDLYDPQTSAYLGSVYLDKSTDHQLHWGETSTDGPRGLVESLDDPRVASVTPLTNAELQAILSKASETGRHSANARLAFAQEASAQIMYRQLLLVEAAMTPQRWVSSDKWDAAATVAPPAEDLNQTIKGLMAEIDRLKSVIYERNATVLTLREDLEALFAELAKRTEKAERYVADIKRLEADVERLTATRRAMFARRAS